MQLVQSQKWLMPSLPLFLLLLFTLGNQPTPARGEDVLEIIQIAKEVTISVLKAWDIVQSSPLASKIEFPLLREKQSKVLQRLKEINRKIEATETQQSQYVARTIESINSFITNNLPLLAKMNDITDLINRISSRYKQMENYEAHKDQLEISTLIAFAEWTVAPNAHSVHHLMDRLHLIVLGGEKHNASSNNLFSQMLSYYEVAADQICQSKQSPQQFVYSLYSDIALTELKGYIMMEFSWMMLRVYGRGNFSQEAELMRRDYEKRTQNTLTLLKEVMRRADRILWRCDPDKFVPKVTYDEVTRLLQGYIENEVDLNTDATCRETCSFYESARSEGCFKELYCARQPKCTGRLYNCKFVDSDMSICPAPSNSTRRYEYIEYENGVTLGQRTRCVRGTKKVDSWWRYLFWHCSYCFCLCDEQGMRSDRYFNLRETLSDVKQNKVVTGLRFVKKNRVFHLQIQQGQLLPRGAINDSTLEWKPVDEYKIFDRNVAKGVDYHMLTYENRAIDLDDIMKTDDSSFVVTGVRFRVLGAHLNLEARLSEYDFRKGELIQPEVISVWQSNDNTDISGKRRQKIQIYNADVPTRTVAKSQVVSKHNEYIDFVNSDMYKDAAQSTVPFIDIQDVVSYPPVPLAGIGIYFKTFPGYGGFIAPKIITYDFTPHVQVPKNTPA